MYIYIYIAGDVGAALQDYKKVTELDPGNEQVRGAHDKLIARAHARTHGLHFSFDSGRGQGSTQAESGGRVPDQQSSVLNDRVPEQ